MDHSARERLVLRSALGRTPACPRIEVLAAAESTFEVRRHVDSCGYCQVEIALLHQFESGEPGAEEAQSLRWIEAELSRREVIPKSAPMQTRPAVRPTRRSRAWRILSWAASLAIVIAVLLYQRPLDESRPSGAGQPAWRPAQFAAVSPVGDLTHAPSILSWEAMPGAASYRVRLVEINGTVIWSASVSTTRAEIPRKVASTIVPGRTFTWDVTAWNAAVQKIGATDLQTIHILPAGR